MVAEAASYIKESRNPSSNNLSTTRAVLYCLGEYLYQKAKGQETPIPRTSLAIAASIFSAFPELKNRENLNKIGHLSPLMIALNEAADIGISAKKRTEKGKLEQWRLSGLLLLSGAVKNNLKKRINEFANKYHKEEEMIRSFVRDFLHLSESRNKITIEDWPTFLELDSAIFVAAYIAILNPEMIKDAGIDIYQEANNFESLKEKYSIFLINQGKIENLNPLQQKLRSLFASVMILKTTDDQNDKNDTNVDRLLDLPNFWDYAKNKSPENPKSEIEKIRETYHQEARILFPKIQQVAADILSSLTSKLKAEKAKKAQIPQEDPTNFCRPFQRITQTTTLRHELQAAQILFELFR